MIPLIHSQIGVHNNVQCSYHLSATVIIFIQNVGIQQNYHAPLLHELLVKLILKSETTYKNNEYKKNETSCKVTLLHVPVSGYSLSLKRHLKGASADIKVPKVT